MGAAASAACDLETDKPMDASDIPDDVAAAKAEIVRLRALMKEHASREIAGTAAAEEPEKASAEAPAAAATDAPAA